MPLVMLLATGGIVAVMLSSGAARNPLSLMFPAMMAMSTVAMLVGNMQGGNRSRELAEKRRDYLRYLDLTRQDLLEHAADQREALLARHPAPAVLDPLRAAADQRERGPGEGIEVRFGLGTVPLSHPLIAPDSGPVDDLEPVSVAALRRLVRTHSLVHDAPIAVDIASCPVLSIYGEPAAVRAVVRAALAQLALAYTEEEVGIAVIAGDAEAEAAWDGLKWLPHHAHPVFADGAGAARMRESSFERMEQLLGGPPAEGAPRIVVIRDGAASGGATWLDPLLVPDRVTLVEVCTQRQGAAWARAERDGIAVDLVERDDAVADGRPTLVSRTEAGETELLRADAMSAAEASTLFAAVARARGSVGSARRGMVGRGSPADDVRGPTTFADLVRDGAGPAMAAILGGVEVAAGSGEIWKRRAGPDRLRVPVGLDGDRRPVYLDLKEAALAGHGPHGLCVGATGSGKSEFLRSFVLGLVATHSPDQLNLVLVDFKGGATFAGLEGVNHVAASITNLAEEHVLVDRMREALEGELVRRQDILRNWGYAKAHDYEEARAAAQGSEAPPLPALVVVVDEFSELLTARPEFAELFVQIGRLGRSLGIHLLLASQRLEEGRLRGLESHLSFRVALKTFSATESRVVLGNSDAFTLPSTPGAGYLRLDSAEPVRFDSFYVSAPPEDSAARSAPEYAMVPAVPAVVRFSAAYTPAGPVPLGAIDVPRPGGAQRPAGASDWELIAAGIAGAGPEAHEVWVPTLEPRIPLGSLGGVELIGGKGAEAAGAETGGAETGGAETGGIGRTGGIPWAVVDLPFHQRRDVLAPAPGTREANALVIGAPRSGKSWALASLAMSSALRAGPSTLHIYGLDFGGGVLRALEALPHTVGIAHGGEPDRVRRLLIELEREREERLRLARAADNPTIVEGSGPQWILVLVDGWHSARAAVEDLDARISALAAEGVGLGISVVIAASRWMDIRPPVRDALATRIELRITDPIDSMIGRRNAQDVPKDSPGSGIIEGGHRVQVLAPELVATAVHEPAPEVVPARVAGTAAAGAVSASVSAIADAWSREAPGAKAPRLRTLPGAVAFSEIAVLSRPQPGTERSPAGLRVPVGIEEDKLGPAYLDLRTHPLVLVYGDAGSGKTGFLRVLATLIPTVAPAEDARMLLVDYRRELADIVPAASLAGRATTDEQLAPMVAHLVSVLSERLGELGESASPRPTVLVLVDDLDLVAGSAGNPLAPLVPFLAHAAEIGFSLVVTRRVAGAARAAFDPVLQRMRDLGAAGLVLDGTKEEGRLVGPVVARPLPPGRAQFHTREGGTALWQLALLEKE